jgi:hypothetical protein
MPKTKTPAAAAQAHGLVRVRVLADCAFGLVGEVAEIPAELVAAARARAQVDDDPTAVAYALAQQQGKSE